MDYLILDTSPGLQYSSINAIVSADSALVITGTDKSDIQGTQRMIQELYDLFEKKTAIIMNKVPCEVMPSKNQMASLRNQFNMKHDLPILEAIPCSCDILRAGGNYIFTEEKPEHPFSKTLEKIASKIERF
jgi:septum site-determining protein MinD